MCGIVAAVGGNDVVPELLDGMNRLEYRGYDSAGVAVLSDGAIHRRRSVGKVAELRAILDGDPISGSIGIGHTRWATHGAPSTNNAHPQASRSVAVVHNGIIENFQSLRDELTERGYQFESETDTEVIPALITENLDKGMAPREAVSSALRRLDGAFAVVVMLAGQEDLLFGAPHGSPLVVGLGEGKMYLASDVSAIIAHTRRFIFLKQGDWVEVSPTSVVIFDPENNAVERPVEESELSSAISEKTGFEHYMLKEIFEHPTAVGNTLDRYIDNRERRIRFPWLPVDPKRLSCISIVATGASRHAGTVAKYWIERLARVPVDVEIASEYAYREPVFSENGIVLAISQSGETADTLRAVRLAKQHGQPVVSIINVPDSSLDRESDVILPTLAAREIGVAATKSFGTQLAVLVSLAIHLARARGEMGRATEEIMCRELLSMPRKLEDALELSDKMKYLAARIGDKDHLIVMARGVLYPIAEAACLMISEVAYIHALAQPGGELKHGKLALVDGDLPVIGLAQEGRLLEKLQSNLVEVRARGGNTTVICGAVSEFHSATQGHIIRIPCQMDEVTSPFIFTVAMQLLAYYLAVKRGTDVDQPRNLAKSVAVE